MGVTDVVTLMIGIRTGVGKADQVDLHNLAIMLMLMLTLMVVVTISARMFGRMVTTVNKIQG